MADTQPAPTEAPAPEQPEGGEGEAQQTEQQDSLGRKWAKLSREQREFKRQRAEWEREREAGQGELARLTELRGKAKGNIGAWLQAGNISPQELNAFLTQNTERAHDPTHQRISEETRGIREKMEAYEQQLAEMKKAQETARNVDKIKGIVDSKPDDFELIRHYDAYGDVAELIDLYYAQRRERITEAEACAIIERTIEQRDEEVVTRALAARKTAKRIGWRKPGESDDDPESQPGEDEGEPSPDEPPEKQRKRPTRGKPKLTNASPGPSQKKPEVAPTADPYANDWERFKASKTRR